MTTESDRNRQNNGESKLTDRQVKFLPVLLASPTYTQACQAGRVSRDTLYEWLKDPAFKAEVDRQHEEVSQQAYGLLTQSLTKAVEALTGLLDDNDKRLKRLAAKDVIEYFAKHKELTDLEARLAAIEVRLKQR